MVESRARYGRGLDEGGCGKTGLPSLARVNGQPQVILLPRPGSQNSRGVAVDKCSASGSRAGNERFAHELVVKHEFGAFLMEKPVILTLF
jgi:hypothetical protein